jgi:iron-sulfur cluster assembly protein
MATLIGISRKKDREKQAPEEVAPELASPVPEDEVRVTEAAATAILEKLQEEGQPDGVFRVGIMGGGCSGLTYLFRVEEAAKSRDHNFEAYGARVVVDPKSLKHLGGTVLDWHDELGKRGFEMKNPNVRSACSCGASFTV